MQTFLPYEDFEKSAEVLDKKRSWKQVVEAKQILCTLRANPLPEDWASTKAYLNQTWINHPAVKMWRGSEEWLKAYYNQFLIAALWDHEINTELPILDSKPEESNKPWWLGDEWFHRAMRARLIEKYPEYYYNLWPEDEGYNDGKYWWPVMDENNNTFKKI